MEWLGQPLRLTSHGEFQIFGHSASQSRFKGTGSKNWCHYYHFLNSMARHGVTNQECSTANAITIPVKESSEGRDRRERRETDPIRSSRPMRRQKEKPWGIFRQSFRSCVRPFPFIF